MVVGRLRRPAQYHGLASRRQLLDSCRATVASLRYCCTLTTLQHCSWGNTTHWTNGNKHNKRERQLDHTFNCKKLDNTTIVDQNIHSN
jgi:hypothetical protein